MSCRYQNVSVKQLVLSLVLTSCLIQIVNGIKCYECYDGAEGDADTTKVGNCEEKMKNNQTTDCPELQPYCMKHAGRVGNVSFIARGCGNPIAETVMDGTDNCKSIHDLKHALKNTNEFVEGTACICSTDGCNHAETLISSTHVQLLILFTVLLITSQI